MLKGGVGVALVVLALAAPAHATVLVDSGGMTPQPYQQWVSEAQVPTVPGSVKVIGGPCPGNEFALACTGPNTPIFFGQGLGTNGRGIFLHEMGHHFDYSMPGWVRVRFGQILRDPRPWGSGGEDSPRERWGEAYALCGLGGKAARRYGYGGYGYSPSVSQNRAVCGLIRSL